MDYVIPPAPVVSLAVAGSAARFPVRRVYCVGRNYAAHAREMGFDPDREPPFFFCKPADAVVPADGPVTVPYPSGTESYQHEIELVVAIARGGRDIPVEQALAHAWGYGVGLDMTRRDLQLALRDKGRPWELGKAFDHSAPIGALHPAERIGHPATGAIWVAVDGQERQRSDLSKLIWSVPEVISHLSRWFELQPGDLVMTGTPEGVGPVQRGQVMEGGIDGLGTLRVAVT